MRIVLGAWLSPDSVRDEREQLWDVEAYLATREAAALGVVEFVLVVESRLVRLRQLLTRLRDVGRSLDLPLGDRAVESSEPILMPPSGTKVRWRPMKPSLAVANCRSSVSTCT